MHKHFLLLFACVVIQASAQTSDSIPPALSIEIGKTHVLESAMLGEPRSLNVYLPMGYNEEDSLTYPVVYVLDGGMDEDFLHVSGLVQFNTQPWIARFPQSIVVGIGGNMRRRDFTFATENLDFLKKMGMKEEDFPAAGGSSVFISALENEIIPFIDQHYRTRSDRTVIGESLAGLLVSELLLIHPAIFQNYIIIAPSLWWGGDALLKQASAGLNAEIYAGKKVYIGACNKEEDETMYRVANQFYEDVKKSLGDGNVWFDYMPEEIHSTVMHQAVYNAFRSFYPKTLYGH